jgi:Fe-S-cluster containining protein
LWRCALVAKEQSIIDSNSSNLCFEGCDGCGAKCCSSNLIFLTLYDFERVSNFFPIFFRLKDNKLSIIFFFYNKIGINEDNKKCIYLKNDLCSIYENRPYACQSFPFSFDSQNSKFKYSNECSGIRNFENIETREITKFSDKGSVNSKIIDNFVTPNYIHHSKDIYKDTDDFLKFCMENNMLINFRTMYKDKKYDKFQSGFQDELYVVNKLKFAFIKLKRPELVTGNHYLDYLNAQVYSVGHIDKMLKLS